MTPWPLTAQQEAFCQHYARHEHGPRAYAAGYPHNAHRSGHWRSERARRLLRRPHILSRVAELRHEAPSQWLAKTQPRKPRQPVQAAGTAAPSFPDLEQLALVAFDDEQPDIARLAALRCLSAGLTALGKGGGVNVNITVTTTPPGQGS